MRLLRQLEKVKKESNERRVEILKEFTAKDEDGEMIIEKGNFKVKPELEKKFEKVMGEFLATSVELQSNPINLADFSNEQFKISASQLLKLESFLVKDVA